RLEPEPARATAPAATPTQAAPSKTGNGADSGAARPVADGNPVIALPERSGARQNVETTATPPRKPAASSPPVRADQVPN
ncbi:MAG TPA: hypothetical protein VF866_04985, partial [Xanthobacteraceae bacterium]